jgi:hypothetical protein
MGQVLPGRQVRLRMPLAYRPVKPAENVPIPDAPPDLWPRPEMPTSHDDAIGIGLRRVNPGAHPGTQRLGMCTTDERASSTSTGP